MTGYSDEQIEADLAVAQPSLLEDATHIHAHGNIHCQCPVSLWTEARDRLAWAAPSLLARAQQAERDRDAALGKVSAIDGGFDVYRRQTERMESRLRAELAEAKAENERLRGHVNDLCDVRDAALAVKAERDRLAAQVAAVRMTLESMESYGLPALVVTPQGALTWAVAVVRAALDGTEQDGESR